MKKLNVFLMVLLFFAVQACEKETFLTKNNPDPLTEATVTWHNGEDPYAGLIQDLYDALDGGNFVF